AVLPERVQAMFPREFRQIDVGPLSLGALRQLLRVRVGAAYPRPAMTRIHEACAGNPFFALELARRLVGRELGSEEPLPVPDDLRELVRERLSRLPAATRARLLAAATAAVPTVALFGGSRA